LVVVFYNFVTYLIIFILQIFEFTRFYSCIFKLENTQCLTRNHGIKSLDFQGKNDHFPHLLRLQI